MHLSSASIFRFLRLHLFSKRGLLWALVALLLAVLLGLPTWGRWFLVQQLEQALHRKVVVQSLEVHPLSLSVDVNGVSVANGHGGELVGWSRLHVQASSQSWRERVAVLDAVQVQGLRVMVTHLGDGRYDIDDLLQPKPPAQTSKPRYAVRALNLQDAHIAWHDAQSQHTYTLAHVQLKGDVQALSATPQGDFEVAVDQLKLAELQTAFALSLPVQLTQGDAHAALHIHWSQPTDTAAEVQATGQVQLNDVALQDALSHSSLTFESLKLQLDEANLRRRTVKASALVLAQPQLRLQLMAQAAAAAQAAKAEPKTQRADATTKATASTDAAWQVALDTLTLQNGTLNFRDERVHPTFHARVSNLNGTVQGLNTRADTQADMTLSGNYSGAAPVTIQARLNPLAVNKFLELRAKVKNVELPRFSGYSGKYAGYAIEKGKFSMDVAYHLRDGQLKAENHLFIDQLTLGERVESPDATSLPVSLAIALLKNRDGQIELDLPVSGSMDDPQFSLGRVVGQAVWNLVSKVVTSPLAFLQNVLGGDGALSYAVFAPGSFELDASARQTLGTLARGLNEKPSLTLEVRGVAETTRDLPAMPSTSKDATAQQDALLSLAQRRAQGVQRWLIDTGKVAPERVFVLAPKARVDDAPATAGAVFTLR